MWAKHGILKIIWIRFEMETNLKSDLNLKTYIPVAG